MRNSFFTFASTSIMRVPYVVSYFSHEHNNDIKAKTNKIRDFFIYYRLLMVKNIMINIVIQIKGFVDISYRSSIFRLNLNDKPC